MDKKILIIYIAIILIAIIGILIVGNGNSNNHAGINYNIPEGYEYDSSYEVTSILSIINNKGNRTVYENGTDRITVDIYTVDASTNSNTLKNSIDAVETLDVDVTDPVEKTIKGTDGFITESENIVTFYYLENGKLIEINAPNESTLEEMLK